MRQPERASTRLTAFSPGHQEKRRDRAPTSSQLLWLMTACRVIVNPAPTPFQVTGIKIGPPGEVVITWNAVTGKTYRVQYIAKVDDSNWLDLSGDTTATGPSAVKVDSTLNGVQQRFYHVL